MGAAQTGCVTAITMPPIVVNRTHRYYIKKVPGQNLKTIVDNLTIYCVSFFLRILYIVYLGLSTNISLRGCVIEYNFEILIALRYYINHTSLLHDLHNAMNSFTQTGE